MRTLASLWAALLILFSSASALAVSPELTLDWEGTLETCVGICGLFLLPGDQMQIEFRQVREGPSTHVLGTDIGVPNLPQGSDPDSDVQNTACLRDFGVGTVTLGPGQIGIHVNGAPESPGATSLGLNALNQVTGGFVSIQTLDGLPELFGQPRLFGALDVSAGTFVIEQDIVGQGLVPIASGTGNFVVPEPALATTLLPGVLAVAALGRRSRRETD